MTGQKIHWISIKILMRTPLLSCCFPSLGNSENSKVWSSIYCSCSENRTKVLATYFTRIQIQDSRLTVSQWNQMVWWLEPQVLKNSFTWRARGGRVHRWLRCTNEATWHSFALLIRGFPDWWTKYSGTFSLRSSSDWPENCFIGVPKRAEEIKAPDQVGNKCRASHFSLEERVPETGFQAALFGVICSPLGSKMSIEYLLKLTKERA